MIQKEILLTLKRTVASLQLINDSQALEELTQLPHAHPELTLAATNALDAVILLRLRVEQAINNQIASELDSKIEEQHEPAKSRV